MNRIVKLNVTLKSPDGLVPEGTVFLEEQHPFPVWLEEEIACDLTRDLSNRVLKVVNSKNAGELVAPAKVLVPVAPRPVPGDSADDILGSYDSGDDDEGFTGEEGDSEGAGAGEEGAKSAESSSEVSSETPASESSETTEEAAPVAPVVAPAAPATKVTKKSFKKVVAAPTILTQNKK